MGNSESATRTGPGAFSDQAGGLARADYFALLGLTGIWVLIALLLGIDGEFPLNDDWAYAWTTDHAMETGTFVRHDFTYIPAYTNVGIGMLFSAIFGPSAETLRASGVFMGWLGVLGAYLLCRVVGARRGPSILGALVTGLNPVYLNLSFTFMTDVPFTTLCT